MAGTPISVSGLVEPDGTERGAAVLLAVGVLRFPQSAGRGEGVGVQFAAVLDPLTRRVHLLLVLVRGLADRPGDHRQAAVGVGALVDETFDQSQQDAVRLFAHLLLIRKFVESLLDFLYWGPADLARVSAAFVKCETKAHSVELPNAAEN
jgi:hypothetical protein